MTAERHLRGKASVGDRKVSSTGRLPGEDAMPTPTRITLHQASRALEIDFSDGRSFRLPCEYLRVYSPSAEVRGHGPGQEVLQVGKREVAVTAVEPVGTYALKLVFSDGHDTGLYSWDYLYELGRDQDALWSRYLQRLQAAGASREAGTPAAPGSPSTPSNATGPAAAAPAPTTRWKTL